MNKSHVGLEAITIRDGHTSTSTLQPSFDPRSNRSNWIDIVSVTSCQFEASSRRSCKGSKIPIGDILAYILRQSKKDRTSKLTTPSIRSSGRKHSNKRGEKGQIQKRKKNRPKKNWVNKARNLPKMKTHMISNKSHKRQVICKCH